MAIIFPWPAWASQVFLTISFKSPEISISPSFATSKKKPMPKERCLRLSKLLTGSLMPMISPSHLSITWEDLFFKKQDLADWRIFRPPPPLESYTHWVPDSRAGGGSKSSIGLLEPYFEILIYYCTKVAYYFDQSLTTSLIPLSSLLKVISETWLV